MKRIVTPLVSAAMLLAVLVPAGALQLAYADTFASFEIPVTCITAEGVPSDKRDFTYSLEVETGDQPMPEGSEGNVKTVHMKKSGKVRFGTISFDHPDTYSYEVRETTREWKRFRRDRSVYKVTLTADNDGKVHMAVRNAAGEKVERIEFNNLYYQGRKKEGYGSPKMGDASDVLKYVLLLSAGSFMLGIFLLRRHRVNRKLKSGGIRSWEKE